MKGKNLNEFAKNETVTVARLKNGKYRVKTNAKNWISLPPDF